MRRVFFMAGQSKGACPSEAQLNRSAYVIQTEEKILKTAQMFVSFLVLLVQKLVMLSQQVI